MISVVIPVYNEEKLVGRCLDAFMHQTTKEAFEIIVVDNNSTDHSMNTVRQYRNKLPITIVHQKIQGRGAARYKGFKIAKGNIIFSTDADCIVPPNWIEYLTHALKQSRAVAVSGPCKIADYGGATNTPFDTAYSLIMSTYRFLFGHYWLSGFNFAIYKKAYDQSGGFNLKLNTQEDIELSSQVSKIGKIKFMPHMRVVYSGRRFQKGLLNGSMPYMTTFIKHFIYKKDDIVLSDVR